MFLLSFGDKQWSPSATSRFVHDAVKGSGSMTAALKVLLNNSQQLRTLQ